MMLENNRYYDVFHLKHAVSTDPAERTDFVGFELITVTFGPSTEIQEQEISIPVVSDNINEATEGFFVVVLKDDITAGPGVTVDLEREGVTLVNIIDDDCKSVASCEHDDDP